MFEQAKQERVALLTGASSGVGRATALKLAQAGFRVVGTGLDSYVRHERQDRSRKSAAFKREVPEEWAQMCFSASTGATKHDAADHRRPSDATDCPKQKQTPYGSLAKKTRSD